MTNKKENRYASVLWLLLAEIAVGALVICVFALIIFAFPALLFYETELYKVITGSALGIAATVINFFTLCYAINRAVDKYMTERGDGEMDEEEAARFANENAAKVQAEVTKSYFLRMLVFLVVGALLFTKQFDVLAVVVPMLAQKPLILMIEKYRGGRA